MNRQPPLGFALEKNTTCDNLLLLPLRCVQTLNWASRKSPGVHLFSVGAELPRQAWQWTWLCWHGRVKGFGKSVFCDLVTAAGCAASAVIAGVTSTAVWENLMLFFYSRPPLLKIYYPSVICSKTPRVSLALDNAWEEFFLYLPSYEIHLLSILFLVIYAEFQSSTDGRVNPSKHPASVWRRLLVVKTRVSTCWLCPSETRSTLLVREGLTNVWGPNPQW